MKILIIILPFIAAVLLGRVLLPYILLVSYKKRLFDPIDKRKQHKSIIPRLGGGAFVPVQVSLFILTFVAVFKLQLLELHMQSWAILPSIMLTICGLILLFIVGLGDDLVGIGYKWKFLTQIVAASFFPFSGLWINDLYGLFGIGTLSEWIGIPLTIFLVVFFINAINLMDGIDGLCSGIVIIGTSVLGSYFIFVGSWLYASFAFITVGVLISFFYYNVFGTSRRGRQIFMGDTGSMTLGYSLAFLSISFAMNNHFIKPPVDNALLVAFSVLIVPAFDVLRVMYVRWRNGAPVFKPDRNHLHHKLLGAGMSPKVSLLVILSMSILFIAINILVSSAISATMIVLLDIVLWNLFHYVLNAIMHGKNSEKLRSSDLVMKKHSVE